MKTMRLVKKATRLALAATTNEQEQSHYAKATEGDYRRRLGDQVQCSLNKSACIVRTSGAKRTSSRTTSP
jgi:hypothetical protein